MTDIPADFRQDHEQAVRALFQQPAAAKQILQETAAASASRGRFYLAMEAVTGGFAHHWKHDLSRSRMHFAATELRSIGMELPIGADWRAAAPILAARVVAENDRTPAEALTATARKLLREIAPAMAAHGLETFHMLMTATRWLDAWDEKAALACRRPGLSPDEMMAAIISLGAPFTAEQIEALNSAVPKQGKPHDAR